MNDLITRHRLCGFHWTDNDGKLGSNHVCGLERGHVGDHDCASCHAVLRQALPPGSKLGDLR